jgi:type II secretory pathway pseudopilin PulG
VAGGGGDDGGGDYWPAFVDVLTTVIMVVTFLLVIMAAAVMALSKKAVEQAKQQIERKYEQQMEAVKAGGAVGSTQGEAANPIRSPSDAESGTSIAELGSILKSDAVDGEERLSIRTRETPDTLKLKVKSIEEANDSKGVEVKSADLLMRIEFEPTAVRYGDETSKQVIDFLKSKQQSGMKFEVWSFAPQTSSVSEAQRIAFYRAAMTRNLLIQSGVSAADISTQVRVTDPTDKDGHSVRVVLKP